MHKPEHYLPNHVKRHALSLLWLIFSITTALTDGGWVYGRDYNLSTCGGGFAASRDDKVKFPTEKEAVKAAAREIKEQIMGQVRWRGDEVPSPMEGKLIRMADDIIHPKPVEVCLF